MSLTLVYLGLVIIFAVIEYYKSESRKTKHDIMVESWDEYNVRVGSRIPKYHGPNPFERRPIPFYEMIKRVVMIPIAILRTIMFVMIIAFAALIGYPSTKYRFQRHLTNKVMRFLCRLILFVFGFYTVSYLRSLIFP